METKKFKPIKELKSNKAYFAFYENYVEIFADLQTNDEQLAFVYYLLETQYCDRDPMDIPKDTLFLKMACNGIKHNLRNALISKRGSKKGNAFKAMQDKVDVMDNAADRKRVLIEEFNLEYLAEHEKLFNLLALEFIAKGYHHADKGNIEKYLVAFRVKIDEEPLPWVKQPQGIYRMFRQYIKNGTIDMDELDLKVKIPELKDEVQS